MTRSVPLMMNVPFVRHQRDLAEVDLLLLDVADRPGTPVSSLTSHTTRRITTLIGAAKVMPRCPTLVDVVLGLLEVVRDELQGAGLRRSP
jgi:hypothetical protein